MFCAVAPNYAVFFLLCFVLFLYRVDFLLIHLFGRRADLDVHADDSLFRIGHVEMILSSQSSHRGEGKWPVSLELRALTAESIVEKKARRLGVKIHSLCK